MNHIKKYLSDRRRTKKANNLIAVVAGIVLSGGLFVGFLFFYEMTMEAMYPVQTGWVVDVGEQTEWEKMNAFANNYGEGWQEMI